MSDTCDFLVVGSGSSGGVLAARLSENGRYRVACLEAGTEGAGYLWTRVPAAVAFLFDNPKANWCWVAQPSDDIGGRALNTPSGRILGGTSAINGMIYNRGQRDDYDGWARDAGCSGWSYADVLPFFKKIESTDIGSDDYRGRSGPIKVTVAEKTSPFFDLFIRAANGVGLPSNPDYSGETQYGVAMAQHTIDRGRRHSVATQYLKPAARRPNLRLVMGAQATSLVFEGRRCVGVRYRRGDTLHELRANREVILSGGAFGSPRLLELSGIGDPTLLGQHRIPVLHALPGVGENLRDHYGPGLQWTFNRKGLSLADRGRGWRLAREVARYLVRGDGLISQGWATMRVFTRSHDAVAQADVAILASPFLLVDRGKRRAMSEVEGFSCWAQLQRPETTGNAHIASADPLAPPAIRPRFLATENDRRASIKALRLARGIVAAAPLADVTERELLPGPDVRSDDEILDYIRRNGTTTYHYAGTCRMGRDPMAVVDERLRVHGLAGLRIADASIMPTLVSGNTSIPCMMIGEKCADMVLADTASESR